MPQDQIGYRNREELINYTRLRLGEGMVDVELDREHYDMAIDNALSMYRRLSSGAVQKSYIFLEAQADTNKYTLPDEVMVVTRLWRKQAGLSGGLIDNGGIIFDPVYGVYPPGSSGGGGGVLSMINAIAMYQETAQFVLAAEYDWLWDRVHKQLTILRRITADEEVLVAVENFIPEATLFRDVYSADWLANWTLAACKVTLGTARAKYTTGLPGPGGAIQLDGEAMKQEGYDEMEKLKQGIFLYEEGSRPLDFIIG